MTPEQIQELLDRLFEIAGAAASKGWELAMRQVYVDVGQTVIWLTVCVLALVFGLRPLIVTLQRENAKGILDQSIDVVVGATFGVVVLMFTTGAIPFLLTHVVSLLINPEWYAVQMLLGLVR